MSFRRLMVLAACASLLGFAASRLVGPCLPRILSMPSRAASFGEPVKTTSNLDGGAPSDVEAEGRTAATPPEPPPVASAKRSARRAKHAPANDRLADDLARGIRKLGEGRYEIERRALDLALRNLGALSSLVRVAPDIRDGKTSGFRLVAVLADGPFAKLGLRPDDVLVSVNGLDIRTPDSALDAHGRLKSASRFALGFTREGRDLVQVYTVR